MMAPATAPTGDLILANYLASWLIHLVFRLCVGCVPRTPAMQVQFGLSILFF